MNLIRNEAQRIKQRSGTQASAKRGSTARRAAHTRAQLSAKNHGPGRLIDGCVAAVLAYEAAAQITTVERSLSSHGSRDDSTEILKALWTLARGNPSCGSRDARLRDVVVHV